MNELKDKYAIITGASGDIGAATAFAFAREGASGIIIADVDRKRAERVVNEIVGETGIKCEFVETNIGKSEDIKKLLTICIDYFGRLDILVNCAGVCNTLQIEEIDELQWDRLMSVNLRGTYLCCREAFSIMKKGPQLFILILAYIIRVFFRIPIIFPDIRIIPVASIFDGPDPFFYAFLKRFNVIKNLVNRTCFRNNCQSATGEI